MAQIIDGIKISERIKNELIIELQEIKNKFNQKPKLSSIIVGDNPATKVYIKNQSKILDELEIPYEIIELKEQTKESELEELISQLNNSNEITGIMLNMPLPAHINSRKMQNKISPQKDVEGITAENLGKLIYAEINPVVAPCTALSVIECLKETKVDLKGKETVIVGHSEIVGKPILLMLLSSLLGSVTPTVCHIATKNLAEHTRRAEILIVAVGKPGLINGDMVQPGVIVIDVGINRVKMLDANGKEIIDEKTGKPKTKIVGDVDFPSVASKASFITPVPGGVGSVTTILLIKNLINLFKLQTGEKVDGYKIL